ncbi:MAG: hypothetical protein E6I56_09490 [Chloroflexi bacterium]|nr:MAG: hypothetical protein E6I56_09490 [Chloroflexota bacterium]
MYRKAMAVPDNLILRYLELVTDAGPDQIAGERQALAKGQNPREVKQRLAERIVQQFHPDAPAESYRESGGKFRSAEPETVSLRAGERTIAELFLEAGLVGSKSEARRLAGQRGLTLNDQVVNGTDDKVTPADGWVLRRGNHRIARLSVS